MKSAQREYVRIAADDVPASIRFDVPRQHEGQIVEYAFGGSSKCRSEHDDGAEFMRRTDRSDGSITFYRLPPARDEIRFSSDAAISMVYRDGEPLRCPTQEDMDTLPVGCDMTADEIEGLDA